MTPVSKEKPIYKKIFRIIYLSDTPAGKAFDIALLVLILLSTAILMLESVPIVKDEYRDVFFVSEMLITLIFSVEYILRLLSIKNQRAYVFSFYGIIDFLSITPFYLSIFFPPLYYFMILRMLRMLRIFRVLNLADYMNDGKYLSQALKASSRKIYIFLLFIFVFITIMGSLMYLVEGAEHGFHSIPQSIYWAVVTITTVGYGDISPATPLGKLIAMIIMLSGYAIIAVPTGIVTSNMRTDSKKKTCPKCFEKNNKDANYCQRCGKLIMKTAKND